MMNGSMMDFELIERTVEIRTNLIRQELLAAEDAKRIERVVNDRLLVRLADMEIEMRKAGLAK